MGEKISFIDLHWRAVELRHVKMLYCLTAVLHEKF